MSLSTWFTFSNSGNGSSTSDIGDLFPVAIKQSDFLRVDVLNIYAKILTDTIERTNGIPDQYVHTFWDNCLASEASEGLVTMLSKAMVEKADLFLVFDKATKVLRKADASESAQIRTDYKKEGESSVGTYVSFRNYQRTDMIKLYSTLEYYAVASLYKNMNLAKAIQLKMSDIRASVALNDRADVEAQAKALSDALKKGNDIMLDAKDMIETGKPDLTATNSAMEFINQRRSFYLGLPASYVTGEIQNGMGDTGQADTKAVDRGLKGYFYSIVRPVLTSLFKIEGLQYKAEDNAQISTGLEALRTFELVGEDLISTESRLKVVNMLFGFPEDTEGGSPRPEPDPPA